MASTWGPAYPYIQKTEGQEVIIKANSYAPYQGNATIGLTEVFYKKILLYSIDIYYREKILSSNDGHYLAIIHTTYFHGVESLDSTRKPQESPIDFIALEILKDGKPFMKVHLKEVIDINKSEIKNGLISWIYAPKHSTSENESSIKMNKQESLSYSNSVSVVDNKLQIITNQNTVVQFDFNSFAITQLPFEAIVSNKDSFNPPKTRRKYIKTNLPDKSDKPVMKDSRNFELAICELFDLKPTSYVETATYTIFIHQLMINHKGNCLNALGTVYEKTSSTKNSLINTEMTKKLNNWLTIQQYDKRSVPKKLNAYNFHFAVDLKPI